MIIPRLFDFSNALRLSGHVCLLVLIGLGPSLSYADDSAFLECARYTYRQMRVACLEATLEEAIMRQNSTGNAVISEDPAAQNAGNAEGAAIQNQRFPQPVENELTDQDDPGAFGLKQQARLDTISGGAKVLVDEISALTEIKPNLWDITLTSGQVWRQTHTKRFDLRVGDTVRIASSRWGDNFRLTTARLSGFIQARRVK